MNINTTGLVAILFAGLFAATPALADKYQCADGAIISVDDCPDGSISRIIPEEIKRFQVEEIKPAQPQAPAKTQPNRGKPQASANRPVPKQSNNSDSEWEYLCNDGSVQDTNDCPDGNMGHLRKRGSHATLKHDMSRPGRIALSEFTGYWNTLVPGSARRALSNAGGEGCGLAPAGKQGAKFCGVDRHVVL